MRVSHEKISRNTEERGCRRKERKKERKNNLSHTANIADEPFIKTSDAETYNTQPVENINPVQPAPEWEQIEIFGK